MIDLQSSSSSVGSRRVKMNNHGDFVPRRISVYRFGRIGYCNYKIICFNCVYFYSQYIYCGIPDSYFEDAFDFSLIHIAV